MGNDNPYSVLWTLIGAKIFSRKDGTTPLIGFNLSNSVDNWTIDMSGYIRDSLNLEMTRLEHHITETYKSIVRQPYDKLDELVEISSKVSNISAKHEGGLINVEEKREHPSDILDYFIPKKEIKAQGLMPALTQNYIDKHEALNRTARVLTENGLSVLPAWKLHK
jgi:iron-sulfur cluster repair protein YtfE (RIC family)